MNAELKRILELVESRRLTPAEGQRRMRELRAAPVAAAASGREPDAQARDAPAHRGIAIIGLSSRYAGAPDAEELWRLLAAGRSAIAEVPASRWDADGLFDADPRAAGKTNCRHGGFIDDIDAFDPLFFNLSGVEAELMDPQQRLFLEGCWTALEDAGYCGDGVSGTSCGVFAGAPASDYATGAQRGGVDPSAQLLMGNDTAILAARISYLLNLRGPSIALNTACSSSLVAIQLACQALASGECELALAGGVCLFVGPDFYLSASTADMLSPDGRCHAFDHRANGFVPGEGVGVVVLKPLDAAVRDGDEVRGVILGVATNQDGKTNGITAPSSRSQTDVQLAAYRMAGIRPDEISLVEAHGTGTALGDPIEVEALSRSFAGSADRAPRCAIGSIKTNIGHTGQAAGVAGLVKVLLALEHETIPPTLHFERANSRIDFERTPFEVATEPAPWPRRPAAPRHAVVSSFGYSGTNAHVVVREPPERGPVVAPPGPQLVLVSAKTDAALRQRLTDLAGWLDGRGAQRQLADVAFTLHAGRKHFGRRAAFVADDSAGLRHAILRRLADGIGRSEPLRAAQRPAVARELREAASRAGGEGRAALLARIAGAYERGLDVEADLAFGDLRGRRIPLPTYPFARERYWAGAAAPAPAPATPEPGPPTPAAGIHLEARPGGARFSYRPRRDDPLVTDHVVQGRPILAATVSLELARAAGQLGGHGPLGEVRDVTWRRPLPSTEPEGIDVTLLPAPGAVRFEIGRAGDGAGGGPYVTGTLRPATAVAGAPAAPAAVDAELVASRLTAELDGGECYRRFRELGFDYGPAFRVVQRVRSGDDEALAWLVLPDALAPGAEGFGLHPLLLDGALQSMLALSGSGEARRQVPYALRSASLHAPPAAACLAHVRRDGEGLLDIDVAAPDGRVLASLRGLAVVDAGGGPPISRLRPIWRPVELPATGADAASPTLVLDRDDVALTAMRDRAPGVPFVLGLPGAGFREVGPHRFELRADSAEDYRRLLGVLPESHRPRRVVVRWGTHGDGDGDGAGGLPDHRFGLHTLLALGQALGDDRSAGPTTIRFLHPLSGDRARPHLAALAAAARTARLEDPDLRIQVVGLADGADAPWDGVLGGVAAGDPVELRVAADGTVTARAFEALAPAQPAGSPIRRGGTYLITGGAGSVGRTLAGHLAARDATVVLLGRSALDPRDEARIAALGAGGGSVVYLQADVADRAALAAALDRVRERFGPLHGIVHAAGVLRDSFLRDKRVEQVGEVLAGKVDGAVWLDELTRSHELDFLVFCSSAVAAVGNVGQADYAFANAFLDELARDREARRRAGAAQGRTISIGWPAWGSGMALGHPVAGDGDAITASEALTLFDEALAGDEPHLVVLKAEQAQLRSLLSANGADRGRGPDGGDPAPATAGHANGEVRDVAEALLVRVLAEELRVPPERIDAGEPLEAYGIDSVMVMQLSRRLEEEFGPLSKTLFFEYSTLGELAGYFAQRHADRLSPRAGNGTVPAAASAPDPAPAARRAPAAGRPAGGDEVAVIGMSGRYPGAADLDAYWRNLALGRDCVGEIPEDRWSLDGFYSQDGAVGTSYSKWGGFLDGVDRFDPVFFGIAPKEADMMDPQERLFLETVWHALEDAGYTRAGLRERETAVFVGVMYGHYQLYGQAQDGRMPLSSFASIANRVSYFFDFHGPSMALDTMCSSSLTAIHLACESLRRGECRVAVAGGVNLSLHPDKYRQLSLGGFASSDGRCRSFGAGGDGYVPGEGVGALLLKPLADAVADGDHVHAVVRGSALNHGGKTNGYTVPNPRAQAAAISRAMRNAGVTADEIGYVEAHGTGTSLGDPIEVNALTRAYGAPSGDRRIPIGSAKSSVGHLESAAGIAAVTKVILQMRHRMLPPTLHAETLNPNIDFAASPLEVQRELAAWEPRPGQAQLTAAVSSFGAGGANAHVIICGHDAAPLADDEADGAQLVVLSARSDGELRALAARLAAQLAGDDPGAPPPMTLAAALRTDLQRRICELLGVREGDLGPHDSLQEGGFDGVARTRLEGELCEAYGLAAADAPADLDSVADLADALIRRSEPALREHFAVAAGPEAAPGPAHRHRLADVAFTLQLGREAMSHRLALTTSSTDDAAARLTAFAATAGDAGVLTGVVRPRSEGDAPPAGGEDDLAADGALARIARRWVGGADVDWRALHAGRVRHRVPLAGYPFAREPHWLPSRPRRSSAEPEVPEAEEAAMTVQPQTTMEPPLRVSTAEVTGLVEQELVGFAADVIGLQPDRLDPQVGLGEYGFDSLAFKTLGERIAERFGVPFAPTVFYERAGVRGVAQWLLEEHGDRVEAAVREPQAPPALEEVEVRADAAAGPPGTARRRAAASNGRHAGAGEEPIAVVGMSGRFPGAPDLDGYWENLAACRDLVTEIPPERWDWRELDSEELPPEERCGFRWGAFLDDVDAFDPLFFGISPAEAEMMDPQQRLLLLTAWAAIEDAGYRPSQLAGEPVGLFAGIQFSDYQHLLHEAGVLNAQAALGNEHSISVNRISYLLDLHGPSEPVNTACSSSLVAVSHAVRSLRRRESTVALAGGIALNLAAHSTVAAGMMGLLSPDGRCKTLDSSANGYVKGEGVGLLVLKPLGDAVADGDQVHAVIRGTSINHGGRAASLTAPNSTAQAALLREAITEAGISADSIGYLELHGTGTELGDPVEINGIKSAFRQLLGPNGASSPARPYCGIGSVKTNIGHLEPASGIAGLMKAILAMRHETLPGIVHLADLNPYVDLAESPFFVVEETMPWRRRKDGSGATLPLRAGVSSFGFGGVNAHVLLEEHRDRQAPPAAPPGDQAFVFSARTPEALGETVRRFVARVDAWDAAGPAPDAGAVAFTLQEGREELDERLAVVAPDLPTLRSRLAGPLELEELGPGMHRGQARKGVGPPRAGSLDDHAAAWVLGAAVDWAGTRPSGAAPRRVSLPTYPFAKRRYWFTPPATPARRLPAQASPPDAGTAGVDVAGLDGEDAVRGTLRAILVDKLKLEEDELDEDRELQDFGVDSIVSAMIVQVVQAELGVEVPLTALVEHPTLRRLSRYVFDDLLEGVSPAGLAGAGGARGTRPRDDPNALPPELLPINVDGNRQRSFWVHGATGYSTWFQNLSQALGPEYPLYAFQAKGTDGYSMPQDMDEMVDHYVDCVRRVQPHGPYVIGGYSFGGLVAMEMARRLHDEGETIRHLVMFDTYPAKQEVFDRHTGDYDEDFLPFYLVNFFLKIDEHPERAIRPKELAHLPSELRLAQLARLARERGQKRISADDIYLYVRGGLTCSAHSEGLYQTYEMRPYTASDVLFFQATDGFTGRATAAYWPPTRLLDGYDYVQPWREVVEGTLRLVELDNDHLNMLEEPTLTPAAQQIEALLKQPPELDQDASERFQRDFGAVTSFGHELLAHRFRASGALPGADTTRTRGDLRERLEVVPAYGRLFDASVDILQREGYLEDRAGALASTPKLHELALTEDGIAATAAELAAEHGEAAVYLPLLTTAQAAVLDVMSGRRPATEVLFPGGSMELVAELYAGNVQTDFYNRLVADRVLEHVRHFVRRYPRSTAQVFEVGAGTGATSAGVFEALAGHAGHIRYHFTDIGAAFLAIARSQFAAQAPYAEFAEYDIERSPQSQGFEPHSMDVVIASNVLHTTHRIDVTVAQCAALLKPGGVLVVNELTQRLDYNTLTFGLTEGWWLYDDPDSRISGSPLLPPAWWRDRLGAAGFAEVEVHGLPGVEEDEQAQCVIAGTLAPPEAAPAAGRPGAPGRARGTVIG